MNPSAWVLKHDELILRCHVQPGAKKTCLNGLQNKRLKIRLSAPPVDGKANQSLIDYLSELCTRPRKHISITHGEKSRFKIVKIEGITVVPQQLSSLLKE